MFVFSIFILLYVSLNNGYLMFPSDLEHTLFGNITSMQDLFLDDNGKQLSDVLAQDIDTDDNPDSEIPDIFQFDKNLSESAHDLNDYNMINNIIQNMSLVHNNVTRRYYHEDYYDLRVNERIEDYKKDLCININTQFLLHIRYEVGKALAQRELVRKDKRYQIGYLFNRLRRLHTEQVKMVAVAIAQNQSAYRTLYSLLRLYEKVVNLDVDIRQTIDLLHGVYNVKQTYDHYKRPDEENIKKYSGDSFIPTGPKPPKIPHKK